jgi:hypothetical protein
MTVVVRILSIVLAYVLACVGASAVFTLSILSPHWEDIASSGVPPTVVWAIVAIGAPVIGTIAFQPATLVVAIAEAFAWRSVLLYAAMGGALALAVSYGFGLSGDIGDPATYFARDRELLAASGITGGFVYWLFAGRRAGAWK